MTRQSHSRQKLTAEADSFSIARRVSERHRDTASHMEELWHAITTALNTHITFTQNKSGECCRYTTKHGQTLRGYK